MDTVWKVVEEVIYTRIKTVVQLHNVLHVFFAGRGTGTAITDIKLDKELESVDQDPLLLVFLDLRKSLKKIDLGRLIQILAGYGVRPKLLVLLVKFWLRQ